MTCAEFRAPTASGSKSLVRCCDTVLGTHKIKDHTAGDPALHDDVAVQVRCTVRHRVPPEPYRDPQLPGSAMSPLVPHHP